MKFSPSVSRKLDLPSGPSAISFGVVLSQMCHMGVAVAGTYLVITNERGHIPEPLTLWPEMGRKNIVCAVQRNQWERTCSKTFFWGVLSTWLKSDLAGCLVTSYKKKKKKVVTLAAKNEISINLSLLHVSESWGKDIPCTVADATHKVARKRTYNHDMGCKFGSLSIKNCFLFTLLNGDFTQAWDSDPEFTKLTQV